MRIKGMWKEQLKGCFEGTLGSKTRRYLSHMSSGLGLLKKKVKSSSGTEGFKVFLKHGCPLSCSTLSYIMLCWDTASCVFPGCLGEVCRKPTLQFNGWRAKSCGPDVTKPRTTMASPKATHFITTGRNQVMKVYEETQSLSPNLLETPTSSGRKRMGVGGRLTSGGDLDDFDQSGNIPGPHGLHLKYRDYY